jgi:hypothetical protein
MEDRLVLLLRHLLECCIVARCQGRPQESSGTSTFGKIGGRTSRQPAGLKARHLLLELLIFRVNKAITSILAVLSTFTTFLIGLYTRTDPL